MKTEKKIQSNIFDFIEISVSCDNLIIDNRTQIYTDFDNAGTFSIGAKKTFAYLCNPC